VSDRSRRDPVEGTTEGIVGSDRALGAGVVAFVAVHLLALLALGSPSLPALVGVEATAAGLLLAGDAAAVGPRRALPATAGVLVAAGIAGWAVRATGGSAWVVGGGLLAAAGAGLYALHRYDGSVAGGGAA
jgi:hypothetical protein